MGAPTLGKGEFEYRHAGAVWRFRNAGNLSAFAADPDVYMPRFGGYDPVAIGRGVAAAGDPRIWMIAGERLYLFQSAESKAIFAADSERAMRVPPTRPGRRSSARSRPDTCRFSVQH